MNFKTTKTNLLSALFGGAALASMFGGMIFVDSAVAQKPSLSKKARCYSYAIVNRTNRGIDFNLDNSKSYLAPRATRRLRRCFRGRVNHPLVKFDRIIGSGYKLTRVRLTPGRNGFDRQGRILILATGTPGNRPVPNAVPNKANLD
jgi:hypothetical protein